jgi:hypothetical protein
VMPTQAPARRWIASGAISGPCREGVPAGADLT